MIYAKIENNAVVDYPYTIDDLRRDNPNVSFPETLTNNVLASYGVVAVKTTNPPAPSYMQNVQEEVPVFDSETATWTQSWSLVSASQTEIEERLVNLRASINQERDRRVAQPKAVSLSTGKAFSVDMANGGRENIGDLVTLAMVQKSSAGETPLISFRDASNVDQSLTNDEMIEVGVQVAAQVQQIHLKARALKDMDPIPEDYYLDSYW